MYFSKFIYEDSDIKKLLFPSFSIIIVSDAQKRFEKYDVDKDGKLNRTELRAFVDSLPEHRKPMNVQDVIDTCDLNENDEIEFDEFIRCLLNNQ